MTRPFVCFGTDHLVALLCALVATAALVHLFRNGAQPTRRLRLGLAALLVATNLGETLTALVQGRLTPQLGLPLHLCDVTLYLTAWALVSLKRLPHELACFFALAGTVPALLTPALAWGFPSLPFLFYFIRVRLFWNGGSECV